LASVLQNRPADCEVIVVQPRSYDDPYQLGDEVTFLAAPKSSTPTDLIRRGVDHAEADIVHLLSCQVEAIDGWIAPVLGHFRDATVGSVSPSLVQPGSRRRVRARGVTIGRGGRQSWTRRAAVGRVDGLPEVVGPTRHGGFYRRRLLSQLLNHAADIDAGQLDSDLALSLAWLGYRCIHESQSQLTLHPPSSAERRLGFRRAIHAGMASERVFWRHVSQQGIPLSLLAHVLTVAGDALAGLFRPHLLGKTLGRLTGLFDVPDCLGHYRRLAATDLDVQFTPSELPPADRPAGRPDKCHPSKPGSRAA